MIIQRSVETSALADRVWSFLVDPDKIPEWCIPAKKLLQRNSAIQVNNAVAWGHPFTSRKGPEAG